ncbi:hypothetical protein BYT27DRAFT_6380477 [Phlegmacium glaucopus]|nr:hypothetical protein BYT27DRAFT_6380477 [Phlegmacium glaucopus]
MGVSYSLLATDDKHFSFVTALENMDYPSDHIDRYRVKVDRRTGQVGPADLISLSADTVKEAIQEATSGRHHATQVSRFTDGALSISYKIAVEDPSIEYVLQLRHHGDVASMNNFMQMISSSISSITLPVPAVYPIESYQHPIHGMGIQITEYVHGVMANQVYPKMDEQQKLSLVPQLARAIASIWEIPIPGRRLIGELKAQRNGDSTISLSIGPDRYNSLGGPFTSVSDYLRSYIRLRLIQLEKQQEVDEFKSIYLARIKAFVDGGMQNIPPVVEQIPVVAIHQDIGLHNIILSQDLTRINAIIDWEFCASAPFASLENIIEGFFRRQALNGFGEQYNNAAELRKAFWGAIPKWEAHYESEATRVFLEWYRFGSFLKVEWRSPELADLAKDSFWAENIRVVEAILSKYEKAW